MRIVLIGSGNVATVLGKKLSTSGHQILEVYSQTYTHAQTLARSLGANAIADPEQLTRDADCYLLAVSDRALEAVAGRLQLNELPVLHTAGSMSMDLLSAASTNYGVFYPLQSLRKEMNPTVEIPILINGVNGSTLLLARTIAESISRQVMVANDESRKHLHISAVLVSNFVNFLYMQARDYCTAHHLPFAILQPLIEHTALRLRNYEPGEVQTGPAVRGDKNVLDDHLKLLEQYPDIQHLYREISAAIYRYTLNRNE